MMRKNDAYLDEPEVKDGESVHVRLEVMDATQRWVAARYGTFDANDHRPHYAVLTDADRARRAG
jgi:hypothetical protein